MTKEDHWYARRLPDDFVARSGDAMLRLSTIVVENWWGYDDADLTQLVRLLLPLLQPLADSEVTVSDELRDKCVALVDGWLRRTECAL